MIYPRTIFPLLESELTTKEALIITGMRQVGKTTVLNHLFGLIKTKNKIMFDLENPLHKKVFETENYDLIWNNLSEFDITNKKKSYIFIDEIQNLPDISKVIKYLSDHYNVKFIVTGSSSYYLKNLFPESLSGRKILFELFPLTFKEFLVFKEVSRIEQKTFFEKNKNKNKIRHNRLLPYFNEYMRYGGFPKVVLENNINRKKTLLNEVFSSYFEHDVKSLADFKNLSKLRDLILLLIPRIGSKCDITKLSNSLSITRETLYSYLSFLENTYFISLIPKFSGSIDRQSAGSKKLYLCDSGIANILGSLNSGQIFEQVIFQNLRFEKNICYYSKINNSEIDFILNHKQAIEVKYTPSKQDIEFLSRRVKGMKIKDYFIISHEYSSLNKVVQAVDI